MTDILAKLQAMSDSPHDYDIGHRWNAVDESIEEIERLREENSTLSDSLAAKADRIDRLGETVARQVAEIERLREDNGKLRAALIGQEVGLQSEIERLRGLLRECDAALGWQGHDGSCLDQSSNDYDPDCPECRLLLRVREALGDVPPG